MSREKIKRKPREKLKAKIDILKPVSIEQFGTAEDPCFGKHFDPRAPECKRCGDCELCAIAMSQGLNQIRGQIEAKQSFKDVEEQSIKKTPLSQAKKEMRRAVIAHIKIGKDKGIKKEIVINQAYGSFRKDGIRQSHIRRTLRKLLSQNKITRKQNNLIWKA